LLAIAIASVILAGCNLPRDPSGTLARVTNGLLRVGISHDPPFVLADRPEPQGREVDLIRQFAESRHARIEWVHVSHSALLRRLEEHEVDLVIGGHDADDPWKERLAFSLPYRIGGTATRPALRTAALPPGENAWLLAFERHVRSAGARALLDGGQR
jgi:ABC-type amino acid transport substrate-binding protein